MRIHYRHRLAQSSSFCSLYARLALSPLSPHVPLVRRGVCMRTVSRLARTRRALLVSSPPLRPECRPAPPPCAPLAASTAGHHIGVRCDRPEVRLFYTRIRSVQVHIAYGYSSHTNVLIACGLAQRSRGLVAAAALDARRSLDLFSDSYSLVILRVSAAATCALCVHLLALYCSR